MEDLSPYIIALVASLVGGLIAALTPKAGAWLKRKTRKSKATWDDAPGEIVGELLERAGPALGEFLKEWVTANAPKKKSDTPEEE